MPYSRHAGAERGAGPADPEGHLAVRSLGLGLPSGHRIEAHAHPWDQFIYASDGVMTVEAGSGAWVVPPRRAVWVPAGVEHAIETSGTVAMRTLYLRPELARLSGACCVVHVPALLRELVLLVVRRGSLDERVARDAHLIAVLLDQIEQAPGAALDLPMPRDPRARRVAERARAHPERAAGLDQLAQGCGASRRTLERAFLRETGMSFGRWRQQARLLHALRRLAQGAPVTEVALDVGYSSTSAFIAMFRRALGTTPGQYYGREGS